VYKTTIIVHRNLFPDNIVKACLQYAHTLRIIHNVTVHNETRLEEVVKLHYGDGMNVMGKCFTFV
jgi:hypothetical protein